MLTKKTSFSETPSLNPGSESYYYYYFNKSRKREIIAMTASQNFIYNGTKYKTGNHVYYNKNGKIIENRLLGFSLYILNKTKIKISVWHDKLKETRIYNSFLAAVNNSVIFRSFRP